MLSQLNIQNFALIKDLNISFHPQMNIITGETGAGKSILLGALGLILGERADVKALGSLDKKCVIEGYFDIKGYGLEEFFDTHELDYDDSSIVRREITASGKSRAFINDTPVPLIILKELGSQLVSLHSQHETLELNNKNFQLSVVDSFARHLSLLKEYKNLFRVYKQSDVKLKNLLAQEAEAQKDIDYTTFIYNELKEVQLHENELELLEKEQETLSHAEEIQKSAITAYTILSEGELPAIDLLNQAKTLLQTVGKNDERLLELAKRIDSTLIDLKDVAAELSTISDTVQADEERLYTIDQRLHLIYNLLKKHEVKTTAELLKVQQEIASKLNKTEGLSEETELLQQHCTEMYQQLTKMANTLSQNRHHQKEAIEKNISQLLAQVGMTNAIIEVNIFNLPNNELNDTGSDAVNFLFSSNLGSALQPLNKVASGGELSRLMLAIKSLVADNIKLPTLIFDEIDTGISGEVAAKTGRLMKQLAGKHQVISVTHLPQIAGAGHKHFFVYKEVKNNTTETQLKALNQGERIEEIAKMLSGDSPTESAMENARELLAI